MRPTIVAGNWKMNGNADQARSLVEQLRGLGVDKLSTEVVLCPSFPYLALVQNLLQESEVKLGAQNASEQASGAFTGEVALSMLADINCQYVIVGHSERRALYGETNALVAKKFAAVKASGLTPVLCVGETLEERESGQAEAVIAEQLEAIIDEFGIDSLENAVVAYEPVWAIGTGKTATPVQAQGIHQFIRELVAKQNSELATKLPILYGGSVKADNAEQLFSQADIDGGLVGGASLKAEEFYLICKAAG